MEEGNDDARHRVLRQCVLGSASLFQQLCFRQKLSFPSTQPSEKVLRVHFIQAGLSWFQIYISIHASSLWEGDLGASLLSLCIREEKNNSFALAALMLSEILSCEL
jgi:hypothetical protein